MSKDVVTWYLFEVASPGTNKRKREHEHDSKVLLEGVLLVYRKLTRVNSFTIINFERKFIITKNAAAVIVSGSFQNCPFLDRKE